MPLDTAVLSEALGRLYDVAVTSVVATVQPAQIASAATAHAQEHPYLTVAQLLGAAVGTGATLANPVLGVAGFSAAGPVAGTLAAGWQSTLGGTVAAGSAFAWCQSAAMGGAAAAKALTAIGIAGGGISAAATAAGTVGVGRRHRIRL